MPAPPSRLPVSQLQTSPPAVSTAGGSRSRAARACDLHRRRLPSETAFSEGLHQWFTANCPAGDGSQRRLRRPCVSRSYGGSRALMATFGGGWRVAGRRCGAVSVGPSVGSSPGASARRARACWPCRAPCGANARRPWSAIAAVSCRRGNHASGVGPSPVRSSPAGSGYRPVRRSLPLSDPDIWAIFPCHLKR